MLNFILWMIKSVLKLIMINILGEERLGLEYLAPDELINLNKNLFHQLKKNKKNNKIL